MALTAMAHSKRKRSYESCSSISDAEAQSLFDQLVAEYDITSPPTPKERLKFIDLLKAMVAKEKQLVNRLGEMITKLETHQFNANIAKTTGVSVTGAGLLVMLGGIIAAPFTLGLSLPVTIAGGVTSTLGGLTTSGTMITESSITKSYENELKQLEEERKPLANMLKNAMIVINLVLHKLVQDGNDQTVATAKVFSDIKKGLFDPTETKNLDQVVKRYVLNTENHFNAMDTFFLEDSRANINLARGIVGTSVSTTRLVFQSITPFLDDVAGIFFRTVTLTGRVVAESVGLAFGGLFIALDIYSLVQSWRNNHPLVPELKKTIKKLEASEKEWEKIMNLLENLPK